MPCTGVLSKSSMATPKGENMDAGNMFAVLNTLAFLGVLPVALAVEGPVMASTWERALAAGPYTRNELVGRIVASGLSFYLYNEVSFYTLEAVHPITHAEDDAECHRLRHRRHGRVRLLGRQECLQACQP